MQLLGGDGSNTLRIEKMAEATYDAIFERVFRYKTLQPTPVAYIFHNFRICAVWSRVRYHYDSVR